MDDGGAVASGSSQSVEQTPRAPQRQSAGVKRKSSCADLVPNSSSPADKKRNSCGFEVERVEKLALEVKA